MGTTLTGTTPQDTYDSLIKVTDNGPLSGTAKYLSDGLGNDSVLALSTAAVGVGTTSPNIGVWNRALTLNTASGNTAYELAVGGAAQLYLAVDSSNAYLQVANATSPLRIYTGAAERMRITDTGNVGIGTSSPAVSLQVGQDTTANSLAGKSIIYGAAQDGTGTPVEILTLARPFQGGVSFLGAASLCVSKDTANASSSRAAKLSIKLSDSADETNFVAASFTKNGLCFNSDTAAANALDDYEEGTWTMGVSFGNASVGVTYSANTGTYTKIGRQVTVNGYVALSNKGSSTGAARITGLPFTIPNSGSNYSVPSLLLETITFSNQYTGLGQVAFTNIELYEFTVLGVGSPITDADFANNSGIYLSFTYFV